MYYTFAFQDIEFFVQKGSTTSGVLVTMKSKLGDIDIATTPMQNAMGLDRVGMSHIECPVLISLPGTSMVQAPAKIDAFVSLDQPQKGIHMSRLFLMVENHLDKSPITPKLLTAITKEFIASHAGISETAHVSVSFDLMIKRPALLSENSGWRSYPVRLWATMSGNKVTTGADVVVKYSSTCPCSAALARQLIQDKFSEKFAGQTAVSKEEVVAWLGKEESIAGTPHGQRSEGKIRTELLSVHDSLTFVTKLIDAVEASLGTPVQAAVKREDEQEFARRNASNLMFAEDAARRMHHAVTNLKLFAGTAVEACHLESLHPHDAVAKVAAGTLKASWS